MRDSEEDDDTTTLLRRKTSVECPAVSVRVSVSANVCGRRPRSSALRLVIELVLVLEFAAEGLGRVGLRTEEG